MTKYYCNNVRNKMYLEKEHALEDCMDCPSLIIEEDQEDD